MIVLIPNYKRTSILRRVIQSVIDCDTAGIQEKIKIVIANNHPPDRLVIESIVGELCASEKFEINMVHRQTTVPAIENWFSAIGYFAKDDEVICLLGDDDIMLPWGLLNRYKQVTKTGADMLLSDFYQRIYFFDTGKKCYLDGETPRPPSSSISSVPWVFTPANGLESSFISNHMYRNTKLFRDGLELAMRWCKEQNWVPVQVATANLPFYLPFAIQSSGGKVFALYEKDVLRGSIAEEAIRQNYADGGSTAFYCLLIYNTFSNPSLHINLKEFEDLRKIYLRAYMADIGSLIYNSSVSFEMVVKTLLKSNLGFLKLIRASVFINFRPIFCWLLGLQGFTLKFLMRTDKLTDTKSFLNMIKISYKCQVGD